MSRPFIHVLLLILFDLNSQSKWKQRDYSGKMGLNEFQEMWTALNQWKESFARFDSDRSGEIEAHELQSALSAFGKLFSLRREIARHAILLSEFLTSGRSRVSSQSKGKTVQFRGYFLWNLIFYFSNIFLTICILLQLVTNAFHRPTRPIQGNVSPYSIKQQRLASS